MTAITAATGTAGVAGAGLGRKRKREEQDIVEVSLESRYLRELGDSRFEVVQLLNGGSHHFAPQVCFFLWTWNWDQSGEHLVPVFIADTSAVNSNESSVYPHTRHACSPVSG